MPVVNSLGQCPIDGNGNGDHHDGICVCAFASLNTKNILLFYDIWLDEILDKCQYLGK